MANFGASLEKSGEFSLVRATSSADAGALISAGGHDAIISFHRPPELDGLELLRRARAQRGKIPFVLVVGDISHDVISEAWGAGADFVLRKDVDLAPLANALSKRILVAVDRNRRDEQLLLAQFSVENAAVSTYWISSDGRLLRANREACRKTGFAEQEIMRMHVWDLDPMFPENRWNDHWDELSRKGQMVFETIHRRKNGEEYPVEITANYLQVGDKAYNFAFEVDITERKAFEQQLTEAINSYRTLSENLPGIVYRCHLQQDEHMVFYNKMLSALTGYEPEELQKDGVCSIVPLIVPEDQDRVLDEVRTAMEKDETFEVEYRLRRKDGQIGTFLEKGRPSRDALGKPLYIDGVIFDITERVAGEKAVEESESRFRQLADMLPAVVFETDTRGRVTYVNAAGMKLTGFTLGEHGTDFDVIDLIDPQERERGVASMARLLREGGQGSGLYHVPKADGAVLELSIHASPIYKGDKAVGLRGVAVDVTQLRRTEALKTAVYRISDSAAASANLEELYASIHSILTELMPAGNFFIALKDEHTNEISFPYFVDEKDPTPAPRRMGRGVTEYVMEKGVPLIATDKDLEELRERGELDIIGALPLSYIGVPLRTATQAIGVMAIQSYDPKLRYKEEDLGILQFVSNQVALAIERKRKLEEAREYLSLLKTTFESTDDGVLIVDLNGSTLASNERFGKIWKLPPTILETRNDEMLLNTAIKQLDDPKPFLERVSWLYAHPEEVGFDVLRFADGRIIERYSQPYMAGGEVQGRIWNFRDATERIRATEALKKSEEELKAIIDSAKDVIFVKDCDGVYLTVNAGMAKLFGVTKEQMVGKCDRDFFPEHMAKDIEAQDRLVLQGVERDEEVLRTVNGVDYVFSLVKAPLRIDGEVVGVCGIGRDVTERKRVEKALQDANQSLNMLNSITRHDVLNQLMVIRGYSDLLRGAEQDEKHLQYINKIEKAARAIRSQIQFTKDFQKLGSSEPRWQDVQELVDQAVSTLEIGDMDISVDLMGLEVFADPMLEKVFYNLVDNTLRHGGKVHSIKVTCEKEGSGLRLRYEDDGVGIKPEDKQRIFDRGFGHNTGFGLFMLTAILRVTGISAEENGEFGNGARFDLHLPSGSFRFREWDDKA